MCIGGRAFYSNRNSERIVHGLPKGLLRLEVRVFAGCRSLKRELVIPSSVVFVGALYSKNQQLLWNLGFLLLKDARELPQNNLQIIPLFDFKNSRSLQHIPIPTIQIPLGK